MNTYEAASLYSTTPDTLTLDFIHPDRKLKPKWYGSIIRITHATSHYHVLHAEELRNFCSDYD